MADEIFAFGKCCGINSQRQLIPQLRARHGTSLFNLSLTNKKIRFIFRSGFFWYSAGLRFAVSVAVGGYGNVFLEYSRKIVGIVESAFCGDLSH